MEISKKLQPDNNINLIKAYQKSLNQQIGLGRKAMLLHYTEFLTKKGYLHGETKKPDDRYLDRSADHIIDEHNSDDMDAQVDNFKDWFNGIRNSIHSKQNL